MAAPIDPVPSIIPETNDLAPWLSNDLWVPYIYIVSI